MNGRDTAEVLIEDYSDSDVVDVMVDGEFIYRDRKLLLYDGAELTKEQNEITGTVARVAEALSTPAEEKTPSMRMPQTRTENAAETESEPNKVELPKISAKFSAKMNSERRPQ